MEADDLIVEEYEQLTPRANNYIWGQSFSLPLNQITNSLELSYLYSSDVVSSPLSLQVKFIIPNGNVAYQFIFKNPDSHSVKQTGGNNWFSAFTKLADARANRVGQEARITILKEKQNYILSLNGWRFIEISGSYNPSDVIVTLLYQPIEENFSIINNHSSNFIKFLSLFRVINLNNSEFKPNLVSVYLIDSITNRKISLKIDRIIDFYSVKSYTDLNIKEIDVPKPKEPSTDKEKQSEPSVTQQEKVVEQKPGEKKKEDIDKSNSQVVLTEADKEKVNKMAEEKKLGASKLKKIETNKLGRDDMEEIFEKAKMFYMKRGLSSEQSELLIYQMGVSFCTSRNSIGDLNSHLVWTTEKGENIKIFKGYHVRLLTALCKTVCNVERLILKNKSKIILELLRSEILKLPLNHARKRGIKPQFAYLACDFLDLSGVNLSEEEQLALNSSMHYVLMKNKHKRSIVNVNQLF
uniref:Minor coat protein n=1 Tax=Yam virus 1 TaxID=3123105 RepID=A0AAU6NE80_9CLOS